MSTTTSRSCERKNADVSDSDIQFITMHIKDSRPGPAGIKLTPMNSVRSSKPASSLRMTLILMAIPISYLILSFPIFIILIYGWIMRVFHSNGMEASYSFDIACVIGTVLMYIDNSINILFYTVLGKNLRKDFDYVILDRIKKYLPIRRKHSI